jgi:hypothetical protein
MASESERRFLIIVTALNEALSGSHYLKGSDGAIPDVSGSGLFRELSLQENLTIEELGVHAAKNKYGTCRGKWKSLWNGKKFSKGENDRDVLLPAYLDGLKESYLPSQNWADFNKTGLYPRRDAGYLFLGEDCREKKHFDCEGFIAWVLVKALNKDKGTWRKGVDWYQNGGGGRLDVYQHSGGGKYENASGKVITQGGILDGDILIRKPNSWGGEHIAFACIKGNAVLEASGKDIGVISSKYHANWTQLARIKSI